MPSATSSARGSHRSNRAIAELLAQYSLSQARRDGRGTLPNILQIYGVFECQICDDDVPVFENTGSLRGSHSTGGQ